MKFAPNITLHSTQQPVIAAYNLKYLVRKQSHI